MGSMAKMVSRILEQEEALRIVLSADRKTTHLLLTWQDTEILQSLDQALSPLSTLTDILSEESYVTVSAVLPIVNLIDNNLSRAKDTDTQLTKDIKQRIKQDITHRYTYTCWRCIRNSQSCYVSRSSFQDKTYFR